MTHVECFASCAACLAAMAGSTSSEADGGGRNGAEGSIRLIGLGDEISTRTGWSSKSEATKSKLRPSTCVRQDSNTPAGARDTHWLKGCSSAIYTGASNRTVRTREPSFMSHKMHFQSWEELRRYRPSLDQLFLISTTFSQSTPQGNYSYLRDWICLVWPRSFRATPFVSISKITTVPSTYRMSCQ